MWVLFVVLVGFALDIQSFAHLSALQQLEISWPTMPRARSADATKKKERGRFFVCLRSPTFRHAVDHDSVFHRTFCLGFVIIGHIYVIGASHFSTLFLMRALVTDISNPMTVLHRNSSSFSPEIHVALKQHDMILPQPSLVHLRWTIQESLVSLSSYAVGEISWAPLCWFVSFFCLCVIFVCVGLNLAQTDQKLK